MNHRVMVVEDDLHISEMVCESLSKEGFHVRAVYNGEEALKVLNMQGFDLILLDLMLPKIDGMTCLQTIRVESMVPILIMSAKGEDVDKVLGLGFGADDYISKPFSMIELIARIKALLRRESHYKRSISPREEVVKVGDLIVNMSNFSVRKFDQEIKLTSKEFSILKLFISKPSQVFTKAQLYNLVWDEEYYGDDNVINVHIRRLRGKIEDDASKPKYIKTLWGIGYKLGDL
ncbi:response regulator transcription factor [Bacillus sp. JJ722]|uniref:response regulator transcription factor n=1 Tax=Bacillus sp. JJ722 TaxID=3122973 RepID=UPI00300033EB